MNLRTKIMAGFASLEADLRNCPPDVGNNVSECLKLVGEAHSKFVEPEPITIEVDAAVGHVE